MDTELHFLWQSLLDPPELLPIFTQLANGHFVRIEAGLWQQYRSYEEWASGIWPEPYYGIRFYCSENTLPMRMVWREEIRHSRDADLIRIVEIWDWLSKLAGSRIISEFDEFEDLLHYVIEFIYQLSDPEPDAAEHYQCLPCLTAPNDFDRVDDSIYTDQHDGEPERPATTST